MMSLQVDPQSLIRQPFLLHQRVPGEYWVVIAGHLAGRVSRHQSPDGNALWLWALTGPDGSGENAADCGDDQSLLAAKNAMRTSLQHYIDRAVSANTTIAWTD